MRRYLPIFVIALCVLALGAVHPIVAHAAVSYVHHLHTLAPHVHTVHPMLAMGMGLTPTYEELAVAGRPASAGQPETVDWQYYDHQPVTTGTTTFLQFFTGNNSQDDTLTNFPYNGQLPLGMYFTVTSFHVSPRIAPAIHTGAAGAETMSALDDLWALIGTQRAIWTFTMNDKKYGPQTADVAMADGGVTGLLGAAGTGAGTATGIATASVANNGILGMGWTIRAGLQIPQLTGFQLTMKFAAAPTLHVSPVFVRFSMKGFLSRQVQ